MTEPDRLGSLLNAVALMEAEIAPDREQRINTLLPHDPLELITLLASMAWCASYLTGQLAEQIGVEYLTVTDSVRGEAIVRFNSEGEQDK